MRGRLSESSHVEEFMTNATHALTEFRALFVAKGFRANSHNRSVTMMSSLD